MKKYPGALFFLACFLSFTNFSSFAANELDCSGGLLKGTYTGKFQKLINKDDYQRTHYVFKQDNTSNTACVQVAEHTMPNRAKQVYNAFILGQKVTINIGDENYISGLSIIN